MSTGLNHRLESPDTNKTSTISTSSEITKKKLGFSIDQIIHSEERGPTFRSAPPPKEPLNVALYSKPMCPSSAASLPLDLENRVNMFPNQHPGLVSSMNILYEAAFRSLMAATSLNTQTSNLEPYRLYGNYLPQEGNLFKSGISSLAPSLYPNQFTHLLPNRTVESDLLSKRQQLLSSPRSFTHPSLVKIFKPQPLLLAPRGRCSPRPTAGANIQSSNYDVRKSERTSVSINSNSPQKANISPVSNKSSSSSIISNGPVNPVNGKQKIFTCHECGKIFNAHYNLTRHMPGKILDLFNS